MTRELNPNLFGQNGGQTAGPPASQAPEGTGAVARDPSSFYESPSIQDSTPVPGIPLPRKDSAQAYAAGYLPAELKAVEGQVQSARAQIAALEQRSEVLVAHIQEMARATNARLERFGAALKRLEEAQSHQAQEMTAKHAVIASKVNERKVTDDKILDLIDRHNVIVRNFENRLVTLQRTLSEQALQLNASHAALDEARQELAKLKKT